MGEVRAGEAAGPARECERGEVARGEATRTTSELEADWRRKPDPARHRTTPGNQRGEEERGWTPA